MSSLFTELCFSLHLPPIFPGASPQSSLNGLFHRHFSNPTAVVCLTVRFSLDFSSNRHLDKNYNSSGWSNLWRIILSMDKDFFPSSSSLEFSLITFCGCWWVSTPFWNLMQERLAVRFSNTLAPEWFNFRWPNGKEDSCCAENVCYTAQGRNIDSVWTSTHFSFLSFFFW